MIGKDGIKGVKAHHRLGSRGLENFPAYVADAAGAADTAVLRHAIEQQGAQKITVHD